MKFRLPPWAILLLICILVGGALGVINGLTEGPIALRAVEAANAARRASFAEADSFEQMDLFTDYTALEEERKLEQQELEKEKRMQQAVLDIKKKFGKNAVLKGMNFEEGATTRERNGQIGGHKA